MTIVLTKEKKMKLICLLKNCLFAFVTLKLYFFYASTAYGASDAPTFSLNNTDFVVSLAFIAFVGILIYLKVPSKVGALLDNRSKSIEEEINNANSILEESKMMLAELEREHKSNIERAKNIIIDAESEAKNILSTAKKEIRLSIERKVKLAQDQIEATEASVIKSIKDKAIDHAILAAEKELAQKLSNKKSDLVIDNSLKDLELGLKKL